MPTPPRISRRPAARAFQEQCSVSATYGVQRTTNGLLTRARASPVLTHAVRKLCSAAVAGDSRVAGLEGSARRSALERKSPRQCARDRQLCRVSLTSGKRGHRLCARDRQPWRESLSSGNRGPRQCACDRLSLQWSPVRRSHPSSAQEAYRLPPGFLQEGKFLAVVSRWRSAAHRPPVPVSRLGSRAQVSFPLPPSRTRFHSRFTHSLGASPLGGVHGAWCLSIL